MPRADPKLIDAAVRRARLGELMQLVRQFAIPIAVTLALIALFLFSTSSPPRHVAFMGGEIVGVHHGQSKSGRISRAGNVRLDDGSEVSVMMPFNHVLQPHQRVVVEVLHHDRPPQRTVYRFVRYEEPQAASETGP